MTDRWHSPGLETRGWHPIDGTRNLPRWIVVMMDSAFRKQMSMVMLHGNSWSGWRENGNPHGDPRPGPIAVPMGIQAPLGEILARERLATVHILKAENLFRITGV